MPPRINLNMDQKIIDNIQGFKLSIFINIAKPVMDNECMGLVQIKFDLVASEHRCPQYIVTV